MKIIGAGMSGMLAAQYFRSQSPLIIEKQPSLPNNHKALLRFRSDVVSKLSGIDFKEVKVSKMLNFNGEHFDKASIAHNNMYSQKVTGKVAGRSISNLDPCTRYVAPGDFINQLSKGLDIQYNMDAGSAVLTQIMDSSEPLISTIPVYNLAKLLNYDKLPTLESNPVWTYTFDIEGLDCDVYQTVYYPNPTMPIYRLSITGNKVIAEFTEDPSDWRDDNYKIQGYVDYIAHFLEKDFGLLKYVRAGARLSEQKYGKLIPCESSAVKDFLYWATTEYNIYSLGRWGTHRQLLMDDVVHDIEVISRLIKSNNYSR